VHAIKRNAFKIREISRIGCQKSVARAASKYGDQIVVGALRSAGGGVSLDHLPLAATPLRFLFSRCHYPATGSQCSSETPTVWGRSGEKTSRVFEGDRMVHAYSRCLIAASALFAVTSTSVHAADRPLITKPMSAPAMPIEYGNLYFGVDWNSHKSLAGYTGVLYAPYGMHQSGLRLSAFGLLGRYDYHGGDTGHELFKGTFVSSDALVGWSHVFTNGAVTLSVGANYQDQRVRPNDPNNPVQGSKLGAKVQADLWMHPTPETLLYALGSYSSAFDTYYAIGRFGYDFTNTKLFIGPEVGGLGNDRTDQLRLGLHMTGLRIGNGKVTISGGWMRERGEGTGGYAAAAIDFSF
jgi:Cellulose biosynthesis protein BcsS